MADLSLYILLQSTLILSAPLILAAMAGLISERSGVMNIALEGKVLGAACATALVTQATGNAFYGLGAGVLASIVLSALHALLTQSFLINHIISGMAINAIALGGTSFISKGLQMGSAIGMPRLSVTWFLVAAFALPFLIGLYLRYTRGGSHLLAVGNDPDKSRQMGLDPVRIRWMALTATGVFCGLAGAMLIANVGSFTDGMTAGRGFIALAAMILGAWRPIPALLACLVFGGFTGLQLQLQGTELMGAQIPPELWTALPYVVTLLALGLYLSKGRAPAGLGKP